MNYHVCKAKRSDNGEWVYGYYVMKRDSLIPGITSHFILRQDPGESLVSWLPIKYDTLCRCTGVEDKMGTMIFENDIVNMRNFGEGYHKTIVYWKNGKFAVDGTQYNFKDIHSKSVEVIGNVFDNTELMEE